MADQYERQHGDTPGRFINNVAAGIWIDLEQGYAEARCSGPECFPSLRLVGVVVAGVTVTGPIAAAVVNRRRRPVEEDNHGV